MSENILSDRSPLNKTVSPRLPWMLKPLTAGQQIVIFQKRWTGSLVQISLSHPLAGNYKPEFRVEWVLKRSNDYLTLLELYMWSDPDDIVAFCEERARLEPDDLWAKMGVQLEVRVHFPQTLIKVTDSKTLTVLSDQEFAAVLPQLQANIASRWNLRGAEWNARRNEDFKAAFTL
ncbi:MAG: hypothetical protein NVS2B12_09000 [Ktedonobacteraceae bacterium]